MDYYHELLDSYSKLKKRSLQLVQEKEEQLPPPLQDSNAVYQLMGQSVNQSYSHPSQDGRKISIKSDGNSLKVKFGSISRPQLLARRVNDPNQLPGRGQGWEQGADGTWIKTEISQAMDAWFASAQQGDAEAANQQSQQQQAEEQQIAMTQEQNEAMLDQFMKDFGIIPEAEGEPAALAPQFDFFGDSDEDNRNRNGFLSNLRSTVNKWIDDVSVPIEDKVRAAKNLQDLVGLAVSLKKDSPEDNAEHIFKLRDISNRIKLRSYDGALLVNADSLSPTDANALVFGIKKDGELAKGVASMLDLIGAKRVELNQEIKKSRKELDQIPSFSEQDVDQPSVGGSTANKRGACDEALMEGAGIVTTLIGGVSPEDNQWNIDRLKNVVKEAQESGYLEELSQSLGVGLDQLMDGESINSVLNSNSKDITQALISRLQVSYPQQFDEDSAVDFVSQLSEDQEGLKAFATFMILRQQTIKNIFGDNSPILTVGGGSRWSRQSDDRNFRRKLDVGYFFPAANDPSLLSHLTSQLEAGENASDYVTTQSIQSFIDDGILKQEDLSPTLQQDLTQNITLVGVSLKTIPSKNKDISQGSINGNGLGASEGSKSMNGAIRTATFKSINQKGGVPQKTIKSLKDFYKTVSQEGSAREVTQAMREKAISHMSKLSGAERSNFKKAFILDVALNGGTAVLPQINTTNYMEDGSSYSESDVKFKNNLLNNIKSGNWEITFGGREETKDNLSKDTKQAFIRDKKTGEPLIRIKMTGERFDVIKTKEYMDRKIKKADKGKISTEESTIIRKYLEAQSKILQELLNQ